MRMFERVAAQPLEVLIGFVAASALFLLAFGLAWMSGGALASHNDPAIVHACVSKYTGQARFLPAGQAPNCLSSETPVELAGGGALIDLAQLQADLDALEAQVPDCLSEDGNADAVFEGCNVRVSSGSGTTNGPVNGVGNLIIGYDENAGGAVRGGSHNLVVGPNHGYSSYGGLVVGFGNTISGTYASVSGGSGNTASGPVASVSGGFENEASGDRASVSGGGGNLASGFITSVNGGGSNEASGDGASVSGGLDNIASGVDSSVSGGGGNLASGFITSVNGGGSNEASGDGASVSGGRESTASGINASVSGGGRNVASGFIASVSGGGDNEASGDGASVSGGLTNTASGLDSSVSGGTSRLAPGDFDWVAGAQFEDF